MAVRLYEHKLKRELYRQNKTIHKNLRFLRLVYGYSQIEIADRFHLGRSTYHAMEHYGRIPDFDLLCEMADFYHIGVDYLISFDISRQIMAMLDPEKDDINAIEFMKKYLTLSRAGMEQIKNELEEIYTGEKQHNSFPWKYVDPMFERGVMFSGSRFSNLRK